MIHLISSTSITFVCLFVKPSSCIFKNHLYPRKLASDTKNYALYRWVSFFPTENLKASIKWSPHIPSWYCLACRADSSGSIAQADAKKDRRGPCNGNCQNERPKNLVGCLLSFLVKYGRHLQIYLYSFTVNIWKQIMSNFAIFDGFRKAMSFRFV